ncbi:hypothetical protein D3C71_1720450 [compost metagenome]
MGVEHGAEVDHVEHVAPQVAQIVMHGARQHVGRESGIPRCVIAAHGADLGHDHEIVRIRRQRLADQQVGDVGAVEIAGVDVVDAGGHGLAQDRKRGVAILGRAEYAWAGQLHCAVAQPFDLLRAQEVTAACVDDEHVCFFQVVSVWIGR